MANGDLHLQYQSYNNLPGADLTFGRVESGIYCLTKPSITFGDPEIGDRELPGEDGIRMGRDYQRSASVTMELGVDTVDYPAVRWWPANMLVGTGRLIGSWPKNPLFLELLKNAGGTRSPGTSTRSPCCGRCGGPTRCAKVRDGLPR